MYKMFIDDARNPVDNTFIVCRTSDEAIEYITQHGWPCFMSLDHDLGGDDTVMCFLHKLYKIRNNENIPDYVVHSANPIGTKNIIAFLESWKKSCQ